MNPLIHNITNYVTANDVANAVLACGARAIMTDLPEEVEDITSICSALNINLGTLKSNSLEAMLLAGSAAMRQQKRIVLDPVGAGSSAYRTAAAKTLISRLHFDIIKGNISEMKAVANGTGSAGGIDADEGDLVNSSNLSQNMAAAVRLAQRLGSVIVITGETDLVADSEKCFVIHNGTPQMSRVIGTGCMLSGMMAAFAAANRDNMTGAAAAAVICMGAAGEIGLKYMRPEDGNASYRNRIIDSIFHMDGKAVDEYARYEVIYQDGLKGD